MGNSPFLRLTGRVGCWPFPHSPSYYYFYVSACYTNYIKEHDKIYFELEIVFIVASEVNIDHAGFLSGNNPTSQFPVLISLTVLYRFRYFLLAVPAFCFEGFKDLWARAADIFLDFDTFISISPSSIWA
jgi:hypothetical protein